MGGGLRGGCRDPVVDHLLKPCEPSVLPTPLRSLPGGTKAKIHAIPSCLAQAMPAGSLWKAKKGCNPSVQLGFLVVQEQLASLLLGLLGPAVLDHPSLVLTALWSCLLVRQIV